MTAFGIYALSTSAIIDTGFETEDAAEEAINHHDDPSDLIVEELCDDHPDQAAYNCGLC